MSRILYFNEEAHKYTDDLSNEYLSTTTLLGDHEPKFDSKGQARRLARLGTGKYKNKSAAQIEAMWKATTESACEKGSIIHDELENSIKEVSVFKDAVKSLRTYDPDDMSRLFTLDDVMEMDYIKPVDPNKFYESVGYKYDIIQKTIEWYVDKGFYLFAELGIYDEKRLISGMIDLLAINFTTGKFVIIDWKTNKDDITFESYYYKRDHEGQTTNTKVVKRNDYLKFPIDNLINCKGSKYGMQLSVYAKMCEQRGFSWGGSIIFHIRDEYIKNQYGQNYRDDNNNYVVDESKPRTVKNIVMPYYTNEVDRIFDYHVKHRLGNGVQFKLGM